MNLDEQVCSLELAKKLKELSVKQDGFYCYFMMPDVDGFCYEEEWNLVGSKLLPLSSAQLKCRMNTNCCISAFTPTELGLLLPNYVITKDEPPFNGFRIFIEKFISVEDNKPINNWIMNYYCDTTELHGKNAFFTRKLTSNFYDPNLANAMAKTLIYLIENGLLNHEMDKHG